MQDAINRGASRSGGAAPHAGSLLPLVTFLVGALLGLAPFLSQQLGTGNLLRATDARVEFYFHMLNMTTMRQGNKSMDVYVRFRYPQGDAYCPFSPNQTTGTCIQYQEGMRSLIMATALDGTPELPLMTEWEHVALALCRGLYSGYRISAVSVAVHVSGDGRPGAERQGAPYEPNAHGSTCTLGDLDFAPVDFFNRRPNLGSV